MHLYNMLTRHSLKSPFILKEEFCIALRIMKKFGLRICCYEFSIKKAYMLLLKNYSKFLVNYVILYNWSWVNVKDFSQMSVSLGGIICILSISNSNYVIFWCGLRIKFSAQLWYPLCSKYTVHLILLEF